MSAIVNLRNRLLAARKSKNEIEKNFFSYMIGVVTKNEKEPSDETVYNALRAYKKQISEQPLTGDAKAVADQEIAFVEGLLPQQMSVDEITDVIKGMFDTTGQKPIFGNVMKNFKDNYLGRFAPGDVRKVWESL